MQACSMLQTILLGDHWLCPWWVNDTNEREHRYIRIGKSIEQQQIVLESVRPRHFANQRPCVLILVHYQDCLSSAASPA